MTEVALASGFNSVRRFNEVFHNLFHRPPSSIRRKSTGNLPDVAGGTIFRIRYRAPYDWDSMLEFLRARAIPGMETVEKDVYKRTVAIGGQSGFIEVKHLPRQDSLCLTIHFPAVQALQEIVYRVRRLFDLGADIETIDEHLSLDKELGPWVARRPGLRAPGGWDGFELAVRAILGQQVSVQAARQLAGKLVALHGRAIAKDPALPDGLTHVFPTARQIASTPDLGVGMPKSRLKTLKAVAQTSIGDPSLFQPSGDVDEAIAKLTAVPGIGDWTAQYVAMRVIREVDAFPASDIGLLRGAEKVLGEPVTSKSLLLRAEAWRPWRAYAAQHLWAADGTRHLNARKQCLRNSTLEGRKEIAMTLSYKDFASPVGRLKLVASETGLIAILWENEDPRRVPLTDLVENDNQKILLETERQLNEYFAGKRDVFSIPLDMRGTAFQKDVWHKLQAIPFGQTRNYGEIAKQLGRPTASRAVGAANGRNPISIVVPCHRVIGSSGKLTGFAGGLDAKAHLLKLETSNRIGS
jgi:O-6-methylguanine DNA methyltransferase